MTTLKLDVGNKLVCNWWDPARKNVFSLLMWLSDAKYLNLLFHIWSSFLLMIYMWEQDKIIKKGLFNNNNKRLYIKDRHNPREQLPSVF